MSNLTSMKLKPSEHQSEPGQNEIHTYWTVIHTKLDGTQRILADNVHNVFPSACIDKIHKMAFVDTTATEVGFNYIALTADTTQTINAAQTTLTGEISTNGLGRALSGTHTHSNGTNTSLVEHTFTLSGSQSDITRAALFNAASSGTMGPFASFSNGNTGAMVSGETVKVSITITTS